MERKIVLKQDILDALLSVGVSKGQTIMRSLGGTGRLVAIDTG